jgi:uncharacterized repeat protein (TIGR03803 family)
MTRLNAWKMAGAVLVLCAATAIVAPAQTFTTLFDFAGTNGAYPWRMSFVQGVDGKLYGTTQLGGAIWGACGRSGCGTVFRITPEGTLASLHLTSANEEPGAGLVLATNGSFYGTSLGGANNGGSVFEITKTGKLTTLYSFCAQPSCADGDEPDGTLIQAADGAFYGTTVSGGANYCQSYGGCGTIFRITPEGKLTTLYNFCSQTNCTDGSGPGAGLVQGTDGDFYGTTTGGGDLNNDGTVFKITASGTLTTLHVFDGTDGSGPTSWLVQGTDGNFYGTTVGGGTGNCFLGCGTVFTITPAGTLTTLHSFNNADGGLPYAGLVQATDGNFYGTTYTLGPYGGGTVFEITPVGTLTTLHAFEGTDGFAPLGGLVQATSGIFYGTTLQGGGCVERSGCGTVYTLSTGLGPFVAFVNNPAAVGQIFGILGQGLTGTTSVLLNGTSASFTVVSETYITATVPSGATTGYVTVATPSGTLTSNVPFHVIP